MKNIIKVLIVIIVLFLIIFCIYKISPEKVASLPFCGSYETKNIQIGRQSIKMDVSDTDCKRGLGLSGRKSLPEGTGMIFIFDSIVFALYYSYVLLVYCIVMPYILWYYIVH